ncbi:MAG: NADH-quinone oxidoreductase subunit NuoH [Planctomycetes bacterium]|nr:NADH-quinone oxidoreductase subunit NuoH [Planctomycetota bacterium]MBI3846029.1 NADH-quinone oxidoreductase subunit NuoH [Planctomycetota bacterium]
MDLLGFVIAIVKALIVLVLMLSTIPILVWSERKLSAWMQDRVGPNRVGPAGLLQPLADVVKFLFKEEVMPQGAEKWLFVAAPVLTLVPALLAFAAIPIGDPIHLFGREVTLQLANVNVGILFVFAVGSLGAYGIVFGAWASNNKFSLLGGLRAAAQLVSYEVSLGLSIVGVLMLTGSLRLGDVVDAQAGTFFGFVPRWNLFAQPIGFLIFTVAAFAETNRAPFDLAEAEQELVAGYHTEYSSMKFALFFMAEYAHMITVSALLTCLFLGGWKVPGLEHIGLGPFLFGVVQTLAFAMKAGFVLFFFQWVRWTLPRFRYDQLMTLGWKVFFPLGVANVMLTGVLLLGSR